MFPYWWKGSMTGSHGNQLKVTSVQAWERNYHLLNTNYVLVTIHKYLIEFSPKPIPGRRSKIRSCRVSHFSRLSLPRTLQSRTWILLSLSLNSSQHIHVSSWQKDQKTRDECICSSKWDHPAPGEKKHLDSNCGAFTAQPVTPVCSSLPTLLPSQKPQTFPFPLVRQGKSSCYQIEHV